ncbi:uncharacterized protein LOC124655826 [Lolium rigidum]|uniref:uncharacterized protein LOC124655826 n=1 Tax=Lolium rigidum TaxID=89674 RepID=UPI001F5C6417|nr:uncharacterized protein LOC124655826 [Lolium rigidum]
MVSTGLDGDPIVPADYYLSAATSQSYRRAAHTASELGRQKMVDPLSLVTAILTVVHLIGSAALTARQNKDKCMELARRTRNLSYGLPDYAKAAGNNMATVHGLERLRDALDEAFTIIKSCQESCILSGIRSSRRADNLDNVDRKITNCISDLNFFSLAPNQTMIAHNITAAGSVPGPAQTYDYASYYQAQGAPYSTACVGFPPPQYATMNMQWIPAPAPYTPAPARSGSNLSTFYTLPTVNKIFDRMFR